MKKNNTVVITGAASGLGLELSKIYLEQECNVAMLDINYPTLLKEAYKLDPKYRKNILTIKCDVSILAQQRRAVLEIINKWRNIDILINNAGICSSYLPLWHVDIQESQKVLNTNILGILNGIKAYFPHLKKGAHIINMASILGFCSSSHMGVYSATKHAVVGLTETLYYDIEAYSKNIHVSVVCPSFTNTQLLQQNHNLAFLLDYLPIASQTALEIVKKIAARDFYIFPHLDVTNIYRKCSEAVLDNKFPPQHAIAKITRKSKLDID